MEARRSRVVKLRRLTSGMALLAGLVASTVVGCGSESETPASPPGVGGAGGDAAAAGGAPGNDAGAANDAGAPAIPSSQATFGLFHAAEGLDSVRWSLSAKDVTVQAGSLDYALATQLESLPAGAYTLELTMGEESVSHRLELRDGGTLSVVVTADVTEEGSWNVSVIEASRPGSNEAADTSAQLYLIHAAGGDARTFDVGIDNLAEPNGTVEPGATSDPHPLDVTRPAIAFLRDGVITEDFTLPVPEAGSRVIAVLLGQPTADGAAADGFRLLVARMGGEPRVVELRADPTVYFLHASGAHSGVDLFIGPDNPRSTFVKGYANRPPISCFAVSQSTNQKLVRAEMADDARFGELRVARVPAGPATLETYLTIAGDQQLPAPLNYSLIGNLLPNQRLRNGAAIGRQGAQTVGGELQAGAEYLLILPGEGPWLDNRAKFADDAPALPLERLARREPGSAKASVRFAASVTSAGTTESLDVHVTLDDETVMTGPRSFKLTNPRSLDLGVHRLTFDIEAQVKLPAPFALELDVQAGQDLLVIATGDAKPEPVTFAATPRADDTDADTTVSAPIDPETKRSVDPNYLPTDGDSSLIQDDCPEQPGPISHKGCPATGLHWLVLDLSTKPPTLRVLPMN